MSMSHEEIRAKRAAIRREIKERMQAELEKRKNEIKERIKREDIPIEEKRKKYRQEAHEEKLRLMERAKEEFGARKRMLGLSREDEALVEPARQPYPEPPPLYEEDQILEENQISEPDHILEPEQILEEDDEFLESQPYRPAEEAFVYTDEEEGDMVSQYEAPIGEEDIVPFGMEGPVEAAVVRPEAAEEEFAETKSIFYYIINLVVHPVQTLDEFDEYLLSPSGLMKVVLFYFASLLPIALFAFVAGGISGSMPGGLLGTAVGSMVSAEAGVLMVVGRTVVDLLMYSLCIAVVNYLVTGEANFVTLTVYFAFVEGVTRLVIYTMVILAIIGALAAVAAPQILGFIGAGVVLLILAFLVWTIALNMIVLMSTYGYGLIIAFLLALGAYILRRIVVAGIVHQFGLAGL